MIINQDHFRSGRHCWRTKAATCLAPLRFLPSLHFSFLLRQVSPAVIRFLVCKLSPFPPLHPIYFSCPQPSERYSSKKQSRFKFPWHPSSYLSCRPLISALQATESRSWHPIWQKGYIYLLAKVFVLLGKPLELPLRRLTGFCELVMDRNQFDVILLMFQDLSMPILYCFLTLSQFSFEVVDCFLHFRVAQDSFVIVFFPPPALGFRLLMLLSEILIQLDQFLMFGIFGRYFRLLVLPSSLFLPQDNCRLLRIQLLALDGCSQ